MNIWYLGFLIRKDMLFLNRFHLEVAHQVLIVGNYNSLKSRIATEQPSLKQAELNPGQSPTFCFYSLHERDDVTRNIKVGQKARIIELHDRDVC